MKGSQRTILFLIADTGAGHRSAANAIRNAINFLAQEQQEEWLARQQIVVGETAAAEIPETLASPLMLAPQTYRSEIVDVFEEYSRFPLREAVKLYGPAIRYNPRLYGRVFHLSNKTQRVLAVQQVATPLIHNGLLRLITTVKPDVIVSIHPMLNHVTIRALQDLGLPIPFLTVVTDLVSVHHAWLAPGADAYILPTEQAKEFYLQRGLDPDRAHVLGMPIDPKFALPVESKQDLQRKLGLEVGKPVVLLVGGGEGSGGLQAAVQTISQAHLSVQLLIIAGHNKRLYVHLQRARSGLHVPAKVFGFVHNMPEMMHASDVVVTKAGPGTICEALACGLPVILSGYVPGQEEGNVTYVLENNVGMMAHDSLELIDALRLLLKPGSEILRQQLANAKRISRPRASFDIAKYILSFLPPAGTPGIWESAQLPKQRLAVHRRSSRPVRRLPSKVPAPLSTRQGRSKTTGLRSELSARRSLPLPRITFLRRSARSRLSHRPQPASQLPDRNRSHDNSSDA